MKDKLLEEGDVIILEKGMKVYAEIPEMFIYANRLGSLKLSKSIVEIGKNYTNFNENLSLVTKLSDKINDCFESVGYNIPTKIVFDFVKNQLNTPHYEHFNIDDGMFIVIKTAYEGGSHGGHDDYPDGHHVYCKRLKNGVYDPEGKEIDFYQSGSFTAMIYNIMPISKLIKKEIIYFD